MRKAYPECLDFRGNARTAVLVSMWWLVLLVTPLSAAPMSGPVPAPEGPVDDTVELLRIDGVAEPVALTLADIEALPLYATELRTGWGMEGRFVGVRLLDLMDAHGLADVEVVRLIALDDYAVSLSRAELQETTALLVTRMDDAPLTLEQSGPLILMWPELAEAVLEGQSPMATWIWSVARVTPGSSE